MTEVMARDELAEAVGMANVPTLLLVLVELTGDRRWLAARYRVRGGRGVNDNDTGGLEPEVQQEIRRAAVDAIDAWRTGTPVALRNPDPDTLVTMLSASVGEEVPGEYGAMLAAEVLVSDDAPGPPPGTRGDDPGVIIIGAGISGLCAAAAMDRHGFKYTVIERSASVGGTWRDNRYPAAAVDTPSHLYSFSFAPHDWDRYFASRAQIHRYLQDVAEGFNILDNVRFNSAVTLARFNNTTQLWDVEIQTAGVTSVLRSRYLISAVGAFNPPKFPTIPGLSSFGPAMFHTAEWPEGEDVSGKDVALIGNGASAMQIVPAIAGAVRSLTIFQRSPHWIAPFEKFRQPVPAPIRRLMIEVLEYGMWFV
jgi:4-hydroxyacetophenone monooxygenase